MWNLAALDQELLEKRVGEEQVEEEEEQGTDSFSAILKKGNGRGRFEIAVHEQSHVDIT